MAKQLINLDNADNAGGDETYTVTTSSALDTTSTIIHYYNNFDVSVDVTIDGSTGQDDAFAEAVQLNTETVTAGSASYFYLTEPWEQIQITLSPAADPTTGTFTANRMDEN